MDLSNIRPAVTVIIPTYNRAGTILRSVRSVLLQTIADFEVIVVDDASSDETEKIIKNIMDDRIRYVRHSTNRGGAAARNTGIIHSKGEFVAFQDSDDEWLCNKLELQIATFEKHPDFGAVYSGFTIEKNGKSTYMPTTSLQAGSGSIYYKLLENNCVSTQTLVVRRELLNQVGGFDASLPRLQDWELVLRLSKVTEFGFVDHSLVKVNYMLDSITHNPRYFTAAMEYILGKHNEAFNLYPTIKANHLFVLGEMYLQSGAKKQAIKSFLNSSKCDFKCKCIFAILCSFFGYSLYYNIKACLKRLVHTY